MEDQSVKIYDFYSGNVDRLDPDAFSELNRLILESDVLDASIRANKDSISYDFYFFHCKIADRGSFGQISYDECKKSAIECNHPTPQ
jgi:hypothetical protein